MALTELAARGPDVDVLRQMIQCVAQRLMDMDVEQLCGAGYAVKSRERTNNRNGFRDRLWDTRAGAIDLKILKLRSGSYFPPCLHRAAPPRARWPR
jgi:putative transposase